MDERAKLHGRGVDAGEPHAIGRELHARDDTVGKWRHLALLPQDQRHVANGALAGPLGHDARTHRAPVLGVRRHAGGEPTRGGQLVPVDAQRRPYSHQQADATEQQEEAQPCGGDPRSLEHGTPARSIRFGESGHGEPGRKRLTTEAQRHGQDKEHYRTMAFSHFLLSSLCLCASVVQLLFDCFCAAVVEVAHSQWENISRSS
jgi:hypothetical protein